MFNKTENALLEQRVEVLEFLICKGEHNFKKDIPDILSGFEDRTVIGYTCQKCGKKIYGIE